MKRFRFLLLDEKDWPLRDEILEAVDLNRAFERAAEIAGQDVNRLHPVDVGPYKGGAILPATSRGASFEGGRINVTEVEAGE